MADLEDALKKLDRLTQEEARMANAEVLRITHSIQDGVKIIDSKVEKVVDKVGDVGDKVQVVIDGTRNLSSHLKLFLTSMGSKCLTDRTGLPNQGLNNACQLLFV